MTATQMLELLIRINRVFDAVACTWTGEARTCVLELIQWSDAHDWNSTPDLLPLKEAIEKAANRSETWDRRCIPLSNAMAPLELRLKNAVKTLDVLEGQ